MIYVLSDIHGNSRRFTSILRKIRLKPEDTLYILGDVVDRGQDGIKLLLKIMKMPNVKMLLGNHEYMMLRVLDRSFDGNNPMRFEYPEDKRNWYKNGGKITHITYTQQSPKTQKKILAFLKSLPLEADVEVNGIKYKLVHAAPPCEYPELERFYGSETEFAVWKRWRWGERDRLVIDYRLVFGHTPTMHYQTGKYHEMTMYYEDNHIAIDCGSACQENYDDYYNKLGRLGCLRLDDMKEFYSSEPWKNENKE